jgi:23S rRNA (cytidine1920-2'-O)/16S rRNA (cytidine1409-2'-O)-methyltransferase
MSPARRTARRLVKALEEQRPDLADPLTAIRSGSVRVNGMVITNPQSLVRPEASIVVKASTTLRGTIKLRAALATFGIPVSGRLGLDVGAAAGGFTLALLEAGARRVYAVDAGHGQLLGSLRQDPRVVNLEATNVARLDGHLIPEVVDIVTIDVSYLSLAAAASQLRGIRFAPAADLIGLIKPMFELRRGSAPVDQASVEEAVGLARAAVIAAGWRVMAAMDSPVEGARGAREAFIHARYEWTVPVGR